MRATVRSSSIMQGRALSKAPRGPPRAPRPSPSKMVSATAHRRATTTNSTNSRGGNNVRASAVPERSDRDEVSVFALAQ
jgi:hypothetical protein